MQSSTERVAEGRKIASARIVTDSRRIYTDVHAWYEGASPAERKMVRGFTPALLATAVHQALALQKMASETRDADLQRVAARKQAERVAGQAAAQSTDVRDQAERVMARVAGSEEPYATQVAQAVTAVKTAADRARNLKNLGDVLDGWLKRPASAPIRLRAAAAGLDADYAESLRALGRTVEKTGAAAEKRGSAGGHSQGELDHRDGINLMFLDLVIAAFDSANQLNPRIKRHPPIATRSYFGRNRSGGGAQKGDAGGAKGEQPTPPLKQP